jgi:aspartyl-tRNA(Asn)/glutamyl-tRNA(Gln) amidotransferase subunit B
VEEIRSRLPELPEAKRDRFVSQYGLPLYDANLLTNSKALADYFEICVSLSQEGPTGKRAKTVSNWLLGDFARLLNLNEMEINKSKVAAAQLVELLDLTDQGTLSGPAAKKVFEEMFNTGKGADAIISEKGLGQISDTREIEEAISQVISANAQPVADFKAGKVQALKFLVGQVMKATRGRANPQLVDELLKKKLGGK